MKQDESGTLCPICLQYRWGNERERKNHNRIAHKVRQGQRLQKPKPPKVKPKIRTFIEPSNRADYISW